VGLVRESKSTFADRPEAQRAAEPLRRSGSIACSSGRALARALALAGASLAFACSAGESAPAPLPEASIRESQQPLASAVEQLARVSDRVVLGRVTRVEALPEGPGGEPGIHSRITCQVAQQASRRTGSAHIGADETVTFWVHGGSLGNRMRVVEHQAQFRAGEEVAVFLYENQSGALWLTGMERGKWTIQGLDKRIFAPEVRGLAAGSAGLHRDAFTLVVRRAWEGRTP